MRKRLEGILAVLLLAIASVTVAPVRLQAQDNSIVATGGHTYSSGIFYRETAGAAIAQYQAVYRSTSDGKVYPTATSNHTTDLYGVAPLACASAATNCRIQVFGKATAIADASISVGDRVGAPTSTAGRLKTVTATLTAASGNVVVPSGGTTVTSSGAQPTLTITQPTITGSPGQSIILGVALTAQSTAGQTFTVFLGKQ